MKTFAVICAVIAIAVTPLYILFFAKGVRALEGIRKNLGHRTENND